MPHNGLRYPSCEELLRLQSAPLDFADKLCMIGNMVPPKLAAAIAAGISVKKRMRGIGEDRCKEREKRARS